MEAVLYAGAIAGALLAVGGLTRAMWRAWSRVDAFLADWFGEPARPGHEAVPSMPERMTFVEKRLTDVERQVTPNGGNTNTLGDRVQRIEKHLTKE